MPRKRIYELAKEWGLASQAILDQLRKVGSKATTAHNTITDDEATKVKALLGVTPPPAPVIGEQRLVSERVVTLPTDGTIAAITTTEQVVERRVQSGVIRRRTTRVESPQEIAPVTEKIPASPVTPIQAAPTPSEESLPVAFELPSIQAEVVPLAVSLIEEAVVRAVAVETKPQQGAVSAAPSMHVPTPVQPAVVETSKPSPRVLDRIDLRETTHVPQPQRSAPMQQKPVTAQRQKPAPVTPLLRKPAPVTSLESRKPQRPRSVVVHTPTTAKRDAGEDRFLRGLQKRRPVIGKPRQAPVLTIPKASKRVINVAEVITVADLAKEMGVKATEVIAKLFGLGVFATINHVLDVDTATLAASEFGYTVENVALVVSYPLRLVSRRKRARRWLGGQSVAHPVDRPHDAGRQERRRLSRCRGCRIH